MANGETNYITVDAELSWAKVFEFNRDMGSPDYPKAETDGEYQLNLTVDEKDKDRMIEAGIPETSMGWPQFKPAEDGKFTYKAKRPHKNKWMVDKETGEKVVHGPPDVFFFQQSVDKMKAEGGTDINNYLVNHNTDVDGLIANGSEAKVKLSVYVDGKKRIVRLERVALTTFIPYFDQASTNSAVDEETGIAI